MVFIGRRSGGCRRATVAALAALWCCHVVVGKTAATADGIVSEASFNNELEAVSIPPTAAMRDSLLKSRGSIMDAAASFTQQRATSMREQLKKESDNHLARLPEIEDFERSEQTGVLKSFPSTPSCQRSVLVSDHSEQSCKPHSAANFLESAPIFSTADKQSETGRSDGGRRTDALQLKASAAKKTNNPINQNEEDFARRIGRCHDFDHSASQCNLQPKCLYLSLKNGVSSPSTRHRGGHDAAGAHSSPHPSADGVAGPQRDSAMDVMKQLLNKATQESLHLLSMRFGKNRCIVNPSYVKELVNLRCRMESKGNLLGLSRDFYRDGLLSQSVVNHLRQRLDTDYICRTICHAYFADPYINRLMLSEIQAKSQGDPMCQKEPNSEAGKAAPPVPRCLEKSWNERERWEKLAIVLAD